jgi:hypothetical protein
LTKSRKGQVQFIHGIYWLFYMDCFHCNKINNCCLLCFLVKGSKIFFYLLTQRKN